MWESGLNWMRPACPFQVLATITGCDTCEAGILIDEKYMLNIDLGNTTSLRL